MKNGGVLYLLSIICFFFPLYIYAQENISVMDFFNRISGEKTVLGIHNREPNSQPTKQTDEIISRTQKTPGLWSGDFLFSSSDVDNRWTMIQECKRQWDNGVIVHVMLHVVSPKNNGEKGVWEGATGVCSDLTDTEWTDLITNGGTLNTKWKARLDIYAQYFQYLKDNGVSVLFRPFHEMNQAMFWWAGRPGANGTAALYRLTRDYMQNVKGLDNIIWVWNMQDLSYDWAQYNPGAEYWDIFSVDVYNNDRFTTYKYQTALSVAGNKPIAIGEADVLPTPQVLSAQPRWVFCMSWAELTFQYNTDQEIRNLYNADNTLTKDELPKFITPGAAVPLDVPTGVYVLNATERQGGVSVQVCWNLVDGAQYYNVFRLEQDLDNHHVYIGTSRESSTANGVEFGYYYDDNVEYGKTYSYRVLAGREEEQSEYSQIVYITLNPETPVRKKDNDKRYGILFDEPFVFETAKIKVAAPEKSEITLVIYDNASNIVFEETGKKDEFVWNLTNKTGRIVANGSYLIIAEAKSASGNVYRYSAKIGVKR